MKDDYDLAKLVGTKKKRINSKAKGGRFERKVAEMLNSRFNTKDFCRTPGSGAFATTHTLPEHLKIYGDLITPINFRFILELKSGYNKEGICNIFKSNSILSDMIAQARRDSTKCSKNFILIIGQDRSDPIVFTDLYWDYDSVSEENLIFKNKTTTLYCLKLVDFLRLPDQFFLT
jgi:hypothetical protein